MASPPSLAVGNAWPTDHDGYTGSVGRIIDERYQLQSMQGRGGMGEVWRALNLVTGHTVALKLIRGTIGYQPDMRRRFVREVRAVAAVKHPNVVEVLDAFEAEGMPVMVMPFLEGETLASLLKREGTLPVGETLQLLSQVVSAVSYVHRVGVVHRDLKPDNVFITEEDGKRWVKVLDFGIAKLAAEPGSGGDSGVLTSTGALLGTPAYMAPEQGFGEPDLDHRVDVWALGVILYECLSGLRPIEGDNVGQVVRNLLTQGITPLHIVAPGLPQKLCELVMRMLSRERAGRPNLQTVGQVFDRLLQKPGLQAPLRERSTPDPVSARAAKSSKPALSPPPATSATVRSATLGLNRPAPSNRSRWLAFGVTGAVGFAGALALLSSRHPESSGEPARAMPSAVATAAAPAAPPRVSAAAAPQPEPSTPAATAAPSATVPRAAPALAKASPKRDSLPLDAPPPTPVSPPPARPSPMAAPPSTASFGSALRRAGAACERSSDCQSGICAAFSCL